MFGAGRRQIKWMLFLSERLGVQGTLDITMFSLLMPVVGFPSVLCLKYDQESLPGARIQLSYTVYILEGVINVAASTDILIFVPESLVK